MTELLSGDRPVFLVHRSTQGGDGLPDLLRAIDHDAGDALEVGVVVNLARQRLERTRAVIDAVATVPLRIADPELHRHASVAPVPPARARQHPYLVDPIPDRPDDAYIRAHLQRQRDAGATALLTPTGWIDDADGERTLGLAIRWVLATRATSPDEPLLVSLALGRNWLTAPALRTALLNEIVDSNERRFYVRVLWDPLSPRYGQLEDEQLLTGYRELAQVAAAEGKILVLPQSGLTGWLATAWGATGLSTGVALPEQAFAQVREIRIKGAGPRPPRPRYFERSLLHTVDLPTHEIVAATGQTSCDCAYCRALGVTSNSVDPADWSRDLASRHQVVVAARLLKVMATRNPRAAAAREVRDAGRFLNDLAVMPVGENRPTHLGLWGRLLA